MFLYYIVVNFVTEKLRLGVAIIVPYTVHVILWYNIGIKVTIDMI